MNPKKKVAAPLRVSRINQLQEMRLINFKLNKIAAIQRRIKSKLNHIAEMRQLIMSHSNDEELRAMQMGYEINPCPNCQSCTLVRSGPVEKCNTCGAVYGTDRV